MFCAQQAGASSGTITERTHEGTDCDIEELEMTHVWRMDNAYGNIPITNLQAGVKINLAVLSVKAD